MLSLGLTVTFTKNFFLDIWVTFPLLVSLALIVTVLGQIVGKKEGWSRFETLYWSFITATTVGYGDFKPLQKPSRIIAILIALVGFVLTGILVAVAVHSASLALAANRRG